MNNCTYVQQLHGDLPVKSIQVHLLMLSLPRLRGTLSAATTVNFVIVKAMHFSAPQLSERASPSKLWWSVNLLLGRGKPPASSDIDISIDKFSQFFHDKVDTVRTPRERRNQLFQLFSQGHLRCPSLWLVSMMSSQPFLVCPTKALRQTRFRSR